MKITYLHGDLLACSARFLIQGCNAQGVMGSGVAKLLRDRDENIFTEYRRTYEKQGNKLHLGQVIPVYSEALEGRTVLNAITQEFYGRDPNVVYVSYDGLRSAMREVNGMLKRNDDQLDIVAMPLIGAGLANGKWSIISQIIEEELVDCAPVVYLIDGIIPDGVQGEVHKV